MPDPLPTTDFNVCTHPQAQQVALANQHASWMKCFACGSRPAQTSKREKFVGHTDVDEIPATSPEAVLVSEDMQTDVENILIDRMQAQCGRTQVAQAHARHSQGSGLEAPATRHR